MNGTVIDNYWAPIAIIRMVKFGLALELLGLKIYKIPPVVETPKTVITTSAQPPDPLSTLPT